jgi:uncharacterized membrane protein
MMTASTHPLVMDYLDRLHRETVRLPADQGRELVADIRGHLDAALGGDPTEAQVRETLDRLGEPAELVDAAGGAEPSRRDQGSGAREAAAVVLLLASAVLFVLWPVAVPMWVAGLVLVVVARRWDVGDKVRAAVVLGSAMPLTTVVVGVLGLAAWSVTECTQGSDGAQVCTSSGGAPWVGWVVVALAVAYVVVLVRTTVRLTRAARRTAGTPVD